MQTYALGGTGRFIARHGELGVGAEALTKPLVNLGELFTKLFFNGLTPYLEIASFSFLPYIARLPRNTKRSLLRTCLGGEAVCRTLLLLEMIYAYF